MAEKQLITNMIIDGSFHREGTLLEEEKIPSHLRTSDIIKEPEETIIEPEEEEIETDRIFEEGEEEEEEGEEPEPPPKGKKAK